MKCLYFDCFSGASGDMILGALIDAGADFNSICSSLNSLDISGFTLSAEKINKYGIAATQFLVNVDDKAHQPNRHLHHVLEIIDKAQLPESVKEASALTFRRIAECEAEVHGTTIKKIHFHEVGAIDSIIDVIGAHLALQMLGIEKIIASPLHVGSGTVKCAHGILPVPAPATALLLKNVPSYGGDVQCELVTPTGAAIIAQVAESFGPMPYMNITRSGFGSGTRDLNDRPNVLRVLIGEAIDLVSIKDQIVLIETNIDDMNPELLPELISELIENGARDAFLTPMIGKKGRPGHVVTAMCDEKNVSSVTTAFFDSSSTIGVRIRRENRICLERIWKIAKTDWGDVKIKIAIMDNEIKNVAPEFEDCKRVAKDTNVSTQKVYAAAMALAVKGDLEDAT